jgi:hypothetical protein
MKPLIYTNWRGKTFVIDETFVEDIKRLSLADGDDPKELDFLTPELLLEWLPTMERIRRHEQLEEMWGQINAADE